MKKLFFLPITAVMSGIAIFSSCAYNPGSSLPPSGSPLNLKKDLVGTYDTFVADSSSDHPDSILASTKMSIQDIITDTGLTYQGKTKVAKVKTFQAGVVIDSNYFYQDPNGDLYRYNFGFSILNQFPSLTQVIGSNVDVGWVLAAKMTAASGTTWVARTDSVLIQSYSIWVYLSSEGEMLADTSFIVGTETIKARHARNTVTATAAGNLANGKVIVDSYYSSDINAVVEDFFRHVKLTGLLNQQIQGKLKIMTSHN